MIPILFIAFAIAAAFSSNLIWLMETRPLVKRYTGGKAHKLWSGFASWQDYFLAKKIIRGEKLKTPILIRINEILVIGTVVLLILTAVEENMHNNKAIE